MTWPLFCIASGFLCCKARTWTWLGCSWRYAFLCHFLLSTWARCGSHLVRLSRCVIQFHVSHDITFKKNSSWPVFQVVDMLSEAVSKRSAWDEVLLCLVPVCSNSITFAMSHNSPLLDHNLSEALEQSQAFGSGASCPAQKPVSVRIACRLLTTLLLHAMELFKEADSSNEPCCYKEAKTSPALLFCKAVLNGFFPLSVALLSQTSDRSLRQLAMHKLLPAFLRASDQLYVADCSLEHDCLR